MSLLAVLFTANAQANDTSKVKKSPEQRAAMQADKMKTDLSLTDVQRNEVYEACLKRMQEASAIKAKYASLKGKEEARARRSEMKLVQSAFDSRMKEVLTADQYAQWNKNKAEHKSKMKARHKSSKTP